MASREDQLHAVDAPRKRRGLLANLFALILLITFALGLFGWLNRERLADDFITSSLAGLGVEATYEIDEIGPSHQVFRNIVVGDPDHPDLTIDLVEAWIEPRLGLPGIGRLRVVGPRLFGTYRDGQLSFGSLDPLLFGSESEEPFELPDMELELVDGRALVESEFGPAGLKASGNGNLRGGFVGELAVAAPKLAGEGCAAEGASLYGELTIDAERPRFVGPLRLPSLDCSEMGLSVNQAALRLDVTGDRTLLGFSGGGRLATGAIAYGSNRMEGLEGTTDLTWRGNALTSDYDVTASEITTAPAEASALEISGSLRTREGLSFVEWQGEISGAGLRPGGQLDELLASTADGAADSFLGPMLGRVRQQLTAEGRGSELAAEFTVRRGDAGVGVAIPTATLRGTSGATLLAISRFQLGESDADGDAPRLFGNFSTGGEGLPRIVGRMERQDDGDLAMRMRMAEYRAGGGSLEIPEMVIVQGDRGAIGISGSIAASGALPGGSARGLVLPVSGNYRPDAGLSLWRSCADIRFDSLTLASLTLDRRTLSLCPPKESAILRIDGADLRVAAGVPNLDLTGMLGETPIRLNSGAVGFAWPGTMAARDVQVALGPVDAASTFAISDIQAQLGGEVSGTFANADIRLDAVPLDMTETAGDWRYVDGRFEIANASATVSDRQRPGRFEPLVARGATLSLFDNAISANALLREPVSNREVTRVEIAHDLSSGTGHAVLNVDDLRFDNRVQPDTLTRLALGVVANTFGSVTGSGRIDWNADEVTSSGRFSSDRLDFAAAFGPVQGASGTIEFTDLLNLTTAPNQQLRIASVNPGIEVFDGVITYRIDNGETLAVQGGRWPFLGGTLALQPVTLAIGVEEVRRYTLEIQGLDAARFVERMELANIAATGSFDGTIPLVFDQNGGRIENGLLISQEAGGNVSYVGELTYEDLSTMANFAFDSLRSLDYRRMQIQMDGPLTGELVTRVRFNGVRQGAGTKSNIITRQLADLPIQFNVNIRAPFYKLITTVKAMYDPAFVRDPRELGLVDTQGHVLSNETRGETGPPIETMPDDDPDIQPPDSENQQ